MLFLPLFLGILGLGCCLDPVPSRQEIETSINRTIDEVERLVKTDPSLPRLSRNQIVDILYNITSQDMHSLEESVEKARSDYQRALMVVLPYNQNDARDKDLKDLFTKPPMVQLIPDSGTMLPFASIQAESPISSDQVLDNLIGTKDSEEYSDLTFQEYKNHKPNYSDIVEAAPEKFSFGLNNLGTSETKNFTMTPSVLDSKEDDERVSTKKPSIEIVYSTSVTQKPSSKILTTTLRSNDDFRPTMPTTRSTVNILTSDQWRYFAPPSTTTTTTTTTTEKPSTTTRRPSTTSIKPTIISQISSKPQSFLPTIIISTDNEGQTLSSYSSVAKFSEMPTKEPELIISDLGDMEMMSDESSPPLFVTPMSSSSSKKLTSFIKNNSLKNHRLNDTEAQIGMRKEVETLLASIGLRPDEEKVKDTRKKNPSSQQGIFATNFQIPQTNNLLPTKASELTASVLDSPSIINQNTFNEVQKDVQKGVNNLTPDVQLLFQRFGLQTSDKNLTTTTTAKTPTRISFRTNSWNNFKPLPRSEVRDQTMRDFLARFGLGIAENRDRKSMKTEKISQQDPPSILEAVPGNMKKILENIGLITKSKSPRKVEATKSTTTTTTVATNTIVDPAKLHIFKPHESLINDDKQRMKINELLDTVKLVQEGKAKVSDVQKAANDLLETTKSLQGGPDPLSLEEILRLYNNDVRNDVKRQESKANFSDVATSAESTTSVEGTTTVEVTQVSDASSGSSNSSKNSLNNQELSSDSTGSSSEGDGRIVTSGSTTTEPTLAGASSNVDDLADSFGGSTVEPDPVLPTPRKSGLYFLVDWNSFLEVGEEDKDKVNLRFAPKVGDRTRFVPITVP